MATADSDRLISDLQQSIGSLNCDSDNIEFVTEFYELSFTCPVKLCRLVSVNDNNVGFVSPRFVRDRKRDC